MIALLRRRVVAVRRYHHYDEERIVKMRREPLASDPVNTCNCNANPADIFQMNQTITKQISDVEKRIQAELKEQTKMAEYRFHITGIMQSICVGHTIGTLIHGFL